MLELVRRLLRNLRKLLSQRRTFHAHLLREPDRRAWVLLEAQEYPQRKLLEQVAEAQRALQKSNVQGRILADPVAALANRKDLTRAAAALAEIPQPEFRVLASPEQAAEQASLWGELWAKGISPRLLTSGSKLRRESPAWLGALATARSELAGPVMVKPAVTEFLKGATPLGGAPNYPPTLAWERFSAHLATHELPAVVEERVPLSFEILTLAVERRFSARRSGAAGADLVDFPPIFYRCGSVTLQELGDIPCPLTESWVARDPAALAGVSGLPSGEFMQHAAEEALALQARLAPALWRTVERAFPDDPVENRFLACEWLVTPTGQVLLNEVKPTQLDKGILSHYAMSHGDSELLVRNLFHLPLPAKVHLTSSASVCFMGVVMTDDIPRASGGARLRLNGFDTLGVDDAMRLGARVSLCPDKMRSVPYAGRRFGVVVLERDSLQDAATTWKEIRGGLRPVYG